MVAHAGEGGGMEDRGVVESAGRPVQSDQDVERGFDRTVGAYGATTLRSEQNGRRGSNRRAVVAGVLLGCAAIAAVTRPAGMAMESLAVERLQSGAGAPEVLSPPDDPLEDEGAIDPDVGTDMDDSNDRQIILPGTAGRGLKYPQHTGEFYNNMLYNANLTLEGSKGWRHWSRIRVRDEVYYMVQKVKNMIERNYKMHINVKQDLTGDRTFLKADVELAQAKMTSLVGEVKGVAGKIGAGLTQLRKAEEEEQRRLEKYKRHYDSDLRRIHAVLSNQTIELEKERHDALRKAYDAQLSRMQEDVDSILAEDRAQMVKNNDESKTKIQTIQDQLDRDTQDMSDLQHTIFTNVEAAKVKETADMNNLTAVHTSLNSYVHNMQHSLDDSLAKQTTIETLARSNQEALETVTTQVNSAAFKLEMLEKKQATDHEDVDTKLSELVTTSKGLDSSLTTQTEAVNTLKDTVETFAKENPEFKKTVEGDRMSLKTTIENLQTEIQKADLLKKDISDLQTSMSTQINDIASKIDDLGGTQTTLATSLGEQGTDVNGLQLRITDLESSAKSSSDEAKADHHRVSAVVEEMQTKLSTLLDLKGRIETLENSVKDNVAGLQDKIAEAEATHNTTRDGLLKSMEALEAKLQEQATTEANAEASTKTSIDGFETDLNDLNSFKTDSEKNAAELVKKLTVLPLLHAPKHTDTHTHIHTCTCTHTHAHTYTHIHTFSVFLSLSRCLPHTHTCTHTHTLSLSLSLSRTQTHTRTHFHTHKQTAYVPALVHTHTHTHTHTHAYTRTRTHTHTNTHPHTLIKYDLAGHNRISGHFGFQVFWAEHRPRL